MPGLYVHLPFCAIKCRYCGFAAFSGQNGFIDRYVEAVLKEADLYPGFAPDTLYLGGGTPTELSAGQLSRLLEGLRGRYGPLARLKESTVEANPETADEARLDVLRGFGVTRLSLGLQAVQERLLRELGRRHTWEGFLRAFRLARERGFSVNVDLMCGLPGQSLAQQQESLERTLGLEPDHVSLYSLHVEEKTHFSKRGVRVDEDLSRDMLEASMERLRAAGLRHYEISNFARPGHESRHNVNYWMGGDYLGLGCGAAGHLAGARWQNEARLSRYLERVAAGERPVAFSERLDGKAKLGETVMVRLRLIDGCELSPDIEAAFGAEIRDLSDRGLVRISRERGRPKMLRLSPEGVFLANEVFRAFVTVEEACA